MKLSPLRYLANKQRVPYLKGITNSNILEVGASVSYNKYLDQSNNITKIDIVESKGVLKGDVRDLSFSDMSFDVVICFNVLEHVFEVEQAIKECHRVLEVGGRLVLSLPFVYPLHDKPNDFWRFTEFSIKKLLKDFSKVDIKFSGLKRIPFSYFVAATK